MNKILLLLVATLVACGLDSPQEKKTRDAKSDSAAATAAASADVSTTASASVTETETETATDAVAVAEAIPSPPTKITLGMRIAGGEFDNPLGVAKLRKEMAYDEGLKNELTHVDEKGRVPLHYAKDRSLIAFLWKQTYGIQKIPAYLVTDKNHQTALHVFATEGYVEGVKYYTKNLCRDPHNPFYELWEGAFGSRLNVLDKDNRTALHLAVIADQKEVVKEILNCYSFNLEPLDSSGRAPMHYAAEKDDFTIGFAILNAAYERHQELHLTQPDKNEESVIDISRRGKATDALPVLEAAALGRRPPRSN